MNKMDSCFQQGNHVTRRITLERYASNTMLLKDGYNIVYVGWKGGLRKQLGKR